MPHLSVHRKNPHVRACLRVNLELLKSLILFCVYLKSLLNHPSLRAGFSLHVFFYSSRTSIVLFLYLWGEKAWFIFTFDFFQNLQCGESVTIEGQTYTISAVTLRYQLRKGKYEPSEKRLDVLSTGRYILNLYLENLLEKSWGKRSSRNPLKCCIIDW